jgi:hypothetical protein
MKIVPRFFHAVSDYLMGLLLLLAPNLFGFSQAGGTATWLPRVVGIMILLQAMTTDYELGLIKKMPFAMHLTADYVIGALLVIAPWIFGIAARSTSAAVAPVIFGLVIIGTSMMTQPRGRPRNLAI